jgi:5'-nucleotidase
MMKVLLTNDDGIQSAGLRALYDQFSRRHQVTVVAPDRERSAVSHGITLHTPLRSVEFPLDGQNAGYAVDGKPADCIKLGLLEIVPQRPDIVVSGINPGANVGISINYSGTVAAAREAALFGLPAIAISINGFEIPDYSDAARFAEQLAEALLDNALPFGTLLNVNMPNTPIDRIKGVRFTRQGIDSLSREYYEKRVDPRNRAYHWLGSDKRIFGEDLSIDGDALCHDYISITPVQCDLTDHDTLARLHGWPVSRWLRSDMKETAPEREDGKAP